MRRAGAFLILAACLAVPGCGGSGSGWTRPGSDNADAERAYQDCLDMAGTAVKTDIDIDQDIAASRSSDLQRSDLLRMQSRETHQQSTDRGAAVIAACMNAKGFAPAAK